MLQLVVYTTHVPSTDSSIIGQQLVNKIQGKNWPQYEIDTTTYKNCYKFIEVFRDAQYHHLVVYSIKEVQPFISESNFIIIFQLYIKMKKWN